MAGTVNFSVTDRGNAFYNRLVSIKPADFVNTFGADPDALRLMDEIVGSIPDGYGSLGDFLNNVSIDGKKLSCICADRYKNIFESAGDDGKNDFMAAEFYRHLVNRDKVIQLASDSPSDPSRSEVSVIRPDVKGRNIFARIANTFRELFGLAGSTKAYDAHARDNAGTFEESVKADADLERAAKAKQPERDEIQRNIAEAEYRRRNALIADDKAFFSEENCAAVEDMGLTALFGEGEHKGSFESQLANESAALDLATIGTREVTRTDFAVMYMLYKGHSLETIFSQEPDAMALKQQMGKEVLGLIFSGDKEKSREVITDMAAHAVRWFADEENYPKFDITDDRSIAAALQKPEYRMAATVAKNLEQIMLYSSAGQISPYIAAVKEKCGDDVYDKYVTLTENFGKMTCYSVELRKDFILSGAYSQQYTSMPPEQQSVIKRDDMAFARAYGASELAHSMREKYGNNVTDMPAPYVFSVSLYNVGTMVQSHRDLSATEKLRVNNQALLGEKPYVPEQLRQVKEGFVSEFEENFRRFQERQQPVKRNVSAEFTASKEPPQISTSNPAPKPKAVEKQNVK